MIGVIYSSLIVRWIGIWDIKSNVKTIIQLDVAAAAATPTILTAAVVVSTGSTIEVELMEDAVLDWIVSQFPTGLDALVTVSGGKIGGCNAITIHP